MELKRLVAPFLHHRVVENLLLTALEAGARARRVLQCRTTPSGVSLVLFCWEGVSHEPTPVYINIYIHIYIYVLISICNIYRMCIVLY